MAPLFGVDAGMIQWGNPSLVSADAGPVVRRVIFSGDVVPALFFFEGLPVEGILQVPQLDVYSFLGGAQGMVEFRVPRSELSLAPSLVQASP